VNRSQEQVESYFEKKEKQLEQVYLNSALPATPNKEAIKSLLMDSLEHHYGSLSECIVKEDEALAALRDIESIIQRVLRAGKS